MSTENITLSNGQQQAFEEIEGWIGQGAGEHSLGGYAGTGKTFLVSELIKRTAAFKGVLAPTGKAAEVLRRKGIPADTIHSAIYRCIGEVEDEETGEKKPIFEDKIPDFLPGDLVVIDEASMVNAKMANDIRAAGFVVLWVGDHGQLPPVGDDPGIMTRPQSRLEEILRQAGDSPIIDFAHDMRQGKSPNTWRGRDERIDVRRQSYEARIAEESLEGGIDQIICGYNRTRHAINRAMRELLGYTDPLNVGDKVICLRNNRNQGIFNGMLFEVLQLRKSRVTNCVDAYLQDMDGFRSPRWVSIDVPSLGGNAERGYERDEHSELFDYGYGITCHKSQGSEWDSIAVVDSPCKAWEIERWRYTAVTRAKERLVIYA